MAFSGIHLSCFFAAGLGDINAPLPGPVIWSETLSDDGIFTRQAPSASGPIRAVVRVCSSIDRFFAYGDDPDPVNGPRHLLRANFDYDFYVDPHAKFACLSA